MRERPVYYVLDANHQPVAVDVLTWERMWQIDNRHVAWTEIAPGIHVSTVFLGIDHNWSHDGDPLLFETMAFGATEAGGDEMVRTATWAAAQAAHNAMVDMIRARHCEIEKLKKQ